MRTMSLGGRAYNYPTNETYRYHFRNSRVAGPLSQKNLEEKQREFNLKWGPFTDRPEHRPWQRDLPGMKSERAELDYRMAPDVIRKDAPFGTIDTPSITLKIIGGRQVPVIEKHPVGVDTYGSRIQPLLPITEKPNHLDPRTYGDNPAGYYNNVQPTALVNRRPDSKDITRQHYKALPPIQANRTRNDMSTVFEAEAWTGDRQPELARETEYHSNYHPDLPEGMEQKRYSSQRGDHLKVTEEEYGQLTRFMPSNVFLPNDPMDYGSLKPVLKRLIAGEMEGATAQDLKDVYLEASQHDKNLRGYCPLEVLDNCLRRHHCHLPDLRLVAAQNVDPSQPGCVNYEKVLMFLDEALRYRDRGEMSDKPRYYMANGESPVKTGSMYKDREVAKLLRTMEIELTKNSYSMDWTKWLNAFQKMDRDHRETLSASQIKDICYDHKLPLSESILTAILALCEDNNRDGQYRWNEFVEFLGRVRPVNTGLPMPRHSPKREHSPQRGGGGGGYTDRVASATKPEVETNRTASPIKGDVQIQIRENTADKQIRTSARQSRPRERPEYQKQDVNDRPRYSPDRRHHRSHECSPDRQFEQQRHSPPPPSYRQMDDRNRLYRGQGHHRFDNFRRESQSPDKNWSHDYNDNLRSFQEGNDAFFHQDRSYRDEQSGYSPSWLQDSQQKTSPLPSPPPHPPRRLYERERQQRNEDMRFLNRDSYDNYMNTWAQKQMRWPDSRFNRPKSYAEPASRPAGAHANNRARPMSYNDSRGYDQFYSQQEQQGRLQTPGRRNRSLSPIRLQPSPDRGYQYPQTHRDNYRVPNPELYREAYSNNYQTPYRESPQHQQYPVEKQNPFGATRFEGTPGGHNHGYSPRDAYGGGHDHHHRHHGGHGGMTVDREAQIKQLSGELRDLESKYHMTRDAMQSHDKPWADRYIRMSQALYNSDEPHKGSLPCKDVLEIVRQYNAAFNLSLNIDDVRMIAMSPGNVDKSGNVVLKPFLTNLAGARMRTDLGQHSHRSEIGQHRY